MFYKVWQGWSSLGVLLALTACGAEATPTATTPSSNNIALDTMTVPTITPQSSTTGVAIHPTPSAPPLPVQTPASSPQLVSDADRQWINQASAMIINLSSYHFTLQLSSPEGNIDIEGDYVAPDKMYNRGLALGETREVVKIGTKTYRKVANGIWQPSDKNPLSNPALTLNDLDKSRTYISEWQYAGQETADGITTDHFHADLNANAPAITAGMFDLWRDVKTQYLYRSRVNINTPAAVATAAALHPDIPPTSYAVPANAVFFAEMTFTRQNDPSIRIPVP